HVEGAGREDETFGPQGPSGEERGQDRAPEAPPRATGVDANRFSPSRSERKRVASLPRTLLPAASSGGEKAASAPLPGATVTMPPLTPLLPGRPTSYSQSPERSYRPAVAITASTRRQVPAETTRSPVAGLTPPPASVAPITARSRAVMSSAHCFVYTSVA